MKILSLFDGISCGRVALERAGIPVERYVAYEIEPNAIKISKKNYPDIEYCGDVTKADFTQYRGQIDLVIAGSPCQSLSIIQAHKMKYNNLQMHRRIYNPAFKVGCLTAVCGGNQQRKVLDGGRARKLTPMEYERLQGLPDGYTAGCCDGARYKAIGNGWTVDVIAYILNGVKD